MPGDKLPNTRATESPVVSPDSPRRTGHASAAGDRRGLPGRHDAGSEARRAGTPVCLKSCLVEADVEASSGSPDQVWEA